MSESRISFREIRDSFYLPDGLFADHMPERSSRPQVITTAPPSGIQKFRDGSSIQIAEIIGIVDADIRIVRHGTANITIQFIY